MCGEAKTEGFNDFVWVLNFGTSTGMVETGGVKSIALCRATKSEASSGRWHELTIPRPNVINMCHR